MGKPEGFIEYLRQHQLATNLHLEEVQNVRLQDLKGVDEVAKLRVDRQQTIDKFILLAKTLGLEADGEYTLGTDPVAESAHLCLRIRQKFPRASSQARPRPT